MIIDATTATARAKSRRPARILVADGSTADRRLLAATLRCDGHDVSEQADARQLTRHLARGPADLVLLDAELPGLSPSLISALAGQPLVLMTSAARDHAEDHAQDLGALGHVHRPIFVDELRQAVRRALAGGSLTRDAA